MVVFSKEDATSPKEIYLLDLRTKNIHQLTQSLPEGISSKYLSKAEPFKLKSFDDVTIEGFFYNPIKSSNSFPAVIYVHGGSGAQSMDEFSPTIQALAQVGIVVLAINYRGSTGYGKKFEDLNNKDWGGGDRRDIRAVAEHFIKKGLIDSNNVGITGGSYGGYMTLIAMTKDSNFYAAGAEKYGMPDLVADYEITNDRFGLWYETEMGNPKTDSVLFQDRSPINFITNLKAPLIVFQGANDTNVPKEESELVVNTLKNIGRDVEYVVYHNEGHGFTHRENNIDCIQRTVNFFKKYLFDTKLD
jgi:dipeptidyl aminopeptidase/acylaminoacyl peptidase